MASAPWLLSVKPTVLLANSPEGLQQVVQLELNNPGQSSPIQITYSSHEISETVQLKQVPPGVSTHEIRIPELHEPGILNFTASYPGKETGEVLSVSWQPPRRWIVHLVQKSHHDVGYTDLPAAVLRQHDAYLDSVIEMVAATRSFPEEAQFRVVVEQAWSMVHFLRHASPVRAVRLIQLLHSGHVELTALFGNMTTELCGHESMARCLYNAFLLRREYGVPIATAEHNDVPGMSWGLCEALCAADIKLFCPGLPRYWNWGDFGLRSFWDDEQMFAPTGDDGQSGPPGLFWWEAPSSKRLLVCDSTWAGGDVNPVLHDLPQRLQSIEQRSYPLDVIRWCVGGGERDNAPYIDNYARTVRDWNAKWAYPKLVCSTNTLFYEDIAHQIPDNLPVHRGELPGQDYPVGATSTAVATGVNRNNHINMRSAECIATVASTSTDFGYPKRQLADAYEEAAWFDEHTWGHHFPAGPTADAAQLEKCLHASTAAALSHDAINKAMAYLSDRIDLPETGFYLVVFNTLAQERAISLNVPLREIENCGSSMMEMADQERGTYLRGVALTDRWHEHPPHELLSGNFDLVDVVSGEKLPFELQSLQGPNDPVMYAPERYGLGQGHERLGIFDKPVGISIDLVFVAHEVPAMGYRVYRLQLHETQTIQKNPNKPSGHKTDYIESPHYLLKFSPDNGKITSLIDKALNRELLDTKSALPFAGMMNRTPEDSVSQVLEGMRVVSVDNGAVTSSLKLEGAVAGHPSITQTFTLWNELRHLDIAIRILRDVTPLSETHLAFPFAFTPPQFRYEGVLSCMTPVEDYLPGAYWDALAVRNWVRVGDEDASVIWTSFDAPIVSLGGLWPGYTSPAHSCHFPERSRHEPVLAEDIRDGHIYSLLYANNFGTNFYCSQPGSALFRYRLTSREDIPDDAAASRLGWEMATGGETIFTARKREGHLPASHSFLSVEPDGVQVVTCKLAEDSDGLILRLWNCHSQSINAQIKQSLIAADRVVMVDLVEQDIDDLPVMDGKSFEIPLPARSLTTLRLTTRH